MLIPLLAIIIYMIYKAYLVSGKAVFRTYLLITVLISITALAVPLLIATNEMDACRDLHNDVLTFKAPPVTANLELPLASVALVSASGTWEPD